MLSHTERLSQKIVKRDHEESEKHLESPRPTRCANTYLRVCFLNTQNALSEKAAFLKVYLVTLTFLPLNRQNTVLVARVVSDHPEKSGAIFATTVYWTHRSPKDISPVESHLIIGSKQSGKKNKQAQLPFTCPIQLNKQVYFPFNYAKIMTVNDVEDVHQIKHHTRGFTDPEAKNNKRCNILFRAANIQDVIFILRA